jgi:hypothetical protein
VCGGGGVYSYSNLIGLLVVVIGNGGLAGSYGHQSYARDSSVYEDR